MLNSFSNITFEYPYIFLIIVIFIICSRFCKAKVQSYFMPHLNIYNNSKTLNSNLLEILKWTTIVFAVIALASPIKELNVINNKKDGVDMVLSLDTSGSMRQIGFDNTAMEKNRWDVVKEIVTDFISKRTNDNIGIVVFGLNVMTASPLSYDKNAQQNILKGLNIGIAGEKTALIDSIAAAVNILKNRDTKSKIIIALTDGDDTASNIPLKVVLKMVKKYNIKIYTIAIAATNPYVLKQLSDVNNGKTFRANGKEDLKEIYATINKLERSKIDQNKIVLKDYYYFYPLFISFFTLLIYVFIKNKRVDI